MNKSSLNCPSRLAWAIIPVKPLQASKMRLAHLLTAGQRAELIASFLAATLTALRQTPALGGILVVTSDASVQALAQQHGAHVLPESAPQGLNVAVRQGVDAVVRAGASAALILPADLPFVTTEDVQQMLALLPEPGNGQGNGRWLMAICSDAAQQGTNALLLSPPTPFHFHYGPGSYHLHLQEGRRHNRTLYTPIIPGFQFDLDTEADWQLYQQTVCTQTTW